MQFSEAVLELIAQLEKSFFMEKEGWEEGWVKIAEQLVLETGCNWLMPTFMWLREKKKFPWRESQKMFKWHVCHMNHSKEDHDSFLESCPYALPNKYKLCVNFGTCQCSGKTLVEVLARLIPTIWGAEMPVVVNAPNPTVCEWESINTPEEVQIEVKL